MVRLARMSTVAMAVVVALLAMQAGVDAKKKISKRKHKTTTTSAPLVMTLPTFTPIAPEGVSVNRNPVFRDDSFVNSAGPAARAASATPTSGGGMSIDSAGDSASGYKKGKGRITIDPVTPLNPLAGTLLISEFRWTGTSGGFDQFVEIYNNGGADHTVASISGTGYGIVASDGVVRCTIPNNTVIPAAGHFLCVNNEVAPPGYSLSSYPAGNGTTATGDATYLTAIPNNSGIALFNNNTGGGTFTLANRFDAVGSTSTSSLFREGAGLPDLTIISLNQSWVRDECGKGGAVHQLGQCTISTPKDTDNNASDFYYVETNGDASAGGGQRLGAPGPQNLSSPIQRNSTIPVTLLDPCFAQSAAPNRVRNPFPNPGNNSTFGVLIIMRTITNNTGANVTRLRFRIIDLDTFPPAAGFADLRPLSASNTLQGVDLPPCGSGVSTIAVTGLTLETPPAQPNGGGFNSSLSVGTVTLGTPLANGATVNVQFLFGVQQTGNFRVYVNTEALP